MHAVAKNKQVRFAVQVVVGLALIAYLFSMARHENVASVWDHVGAPTLFMACGCFAVAAVLSARRWQLLLRYQGVEENLIRLTEVYFIGLFCSLFLPTAAGGDAFRVYDVSRRSRSTARVLLATLQDRLIGLGAVMLVGLAAAIWFHEALPSKLFAAVIVVNALGLGAVAAAMFHGLVIERLRHLFTGQHAPAAIRGMLEWKVAVHARKFLRPLREVRSLNGRRIFRVITLAFATFGVAVAMHQVVCHALDVACEPFALCVVVSLVGVARMVAISPNGIGVGEGAFVFLMSLFGVAAEKAAVVALSLLGIQTVMSLFGGLLLLRRTLNGTRLPAKPTVAQTPEILSYRTASQNREEAHLVPLRRAEGLFTPSSPGTPGGECRGEGGQNPAQNLEVSAGSSPSPPTPLPRSTGGEGRLFPAASLTDYSTIEFADVSAAILAGGLATRLGSITAKVPKALVEVAGRPFIDHQLDLLRRNGVRRVVLCLGHLGEQVANHVGDGSRLGLEITYCFDGDKLLGTGGAIRRALPMLGDAFWVLYGDSYMDIDYQAVFRAFQRQQVLGLMTVLRNANQWDRSNVIFHDGRLVCYDKHQRRQDMEHIDYGVSLFRRAALERIPENAKYDLADLMHDLVQSGDMAGFEVHERFYEIGSPQGLEQTARYLNAKHSGQRALASAGGISSC